jgi:hypothetical protein
VPFGIRIAGRSVFVEGPESGDEHDNSSASAVHALRVVDATLYRRPEKASQLVQGKRLAADRADFDPALEHTRFLAQPPALHARPDGLGCPESGVAPGLIEPGPASPYPKQFIIPLQEPPRVVVPAYRILTTPFMPRSFPSAVGKSLLTRNAIRQSRGPHSAMSHPGGAPVALR